MTRLVRVFYWAKYEEIHSNRNKKDGATYEGMMATKEP